MRRRAALYCCYCGDREREDYMTRVPERKDLRQKWIDALGQGFAETCGNFKQPRICLVHFKEVRHAVRGVYAVPRPMPFFNYNLGEKRKTKKKDDLEMSLDDPNMDENNNDNGDSDEIKEEEYAIFDKGEHANYEVFGSYRHEEMNEESISDIEPEPKVEKNVVLDKYDQTILEVIEKFRYVGKIKPSRKKRKVALWTPKMDCRYCGVKHPTKKTCTKVPSNRKRLLEWAHILGPEFLENCDRNSHNFICLSHFDILSNGKRLNYALPIPFEFKKEEGEEDSDDDDEEEEELNVVD